MDEVKIFIYSFLISILVFITISNFHYHSGYYYHVNFIPLILGISGCRDAVLILNGKEKKS